MKLNKPKYFAFFFLFCFLTSFSAFTLNHFNSVTNKFEFKKVCGIICFSQNQEQGTASTYFLFEENEDDTEDYFQAQFITILFSQLEFIQPKLISEMAMKEKMITPIYLLVCNFRI